jgi:hypothetical protein
MSWSYKMDSMNKQRVGRFHEMPKNELIVSS